MRSFVRRLVAAVTAAMVISLVAAPSMSAAGPTWSHRDVNVCGPASAGTAACASVARVLYQNGSEFLAKTPGDLGRIAKPAASVSYTALGIRAAYGITGVGDPSRVIAIVDAYDDVNAYANLQTYRSSMGLPAIGNCSLSTLTGLTSTSSSPCFAKVNQTGGTSYPRANSGWATEIDLDLQAASAVCPMCSVLLIEANSASFADLGTAVTTASNTQHVLAISNSYSSSGDASGASYPAWDTAATKGIAVMASTGDSGYGVGFPASATNVLGVGGTNLQVDSTGARSSETAWSGAGSGCSTYNAAPSWQKISGSPCGIKKAIADLSADADPNSGFQIYTTYNHRSGWWIFGGTSLSSPLMGALYAMQGGYGGTTLAAQYAWGSTTPYYDVMSGSNGSCSPSVLCNAGTGWDGPTGRGSIQMAAVSQTLTSIAVSPASATVTAGGGTQQFTAQELDQTGKPMATQPSSFNWSVNGGGSINGNGLFTAGASGGTFTVTASADGKSGTASVYVQVPMSISVKPASVSVAVNGTQQFTATENDQIGGAMATQPAFVWSTDQNCAGAITTAGFFTAGSSAGACTVTATADNLSGTASVTVTAAAPDFSLSASPTSATVSRGASTSYTISVVQLNGFSDSVSLSVSGLPSGVSATWANDPASVALPATLTLSTTNSTKTRNYNLTVTGVSGSLSHSLTVSLRVTK
jgi:hypothetical protein